MCLISSRSRSLAPMRKYGRMAAIEAGAMLQVPALWPLEVANALTVLVRRRKLTDPKRPTVVARLATQS